MRCLGFGAGLSKRCRLAATLGVAVASTAVFVAPTEMVLRAQGNLPLINPGDIAYLGSYRVPAGFEYGGMALALSPTRDSIYLTDFADGFRTAELIIPRNLGETMTIRQPENDAFGGKLSQVGPDGGNGYRVGGMLTHDNRLIMTAFVYYDASHDQSASHFSRPLSLSSGSVTGPWNPGPLNPGYYAGYMAEVPSEWQSVLGGPTVTGNCCTSIISRTSYGPALFAFDPASTGQTAIPLVYYDRAHQTLGDYSAPGPNPIFNGATRVTGVALIPGTSTAIFIGTTGLGVRCYGTGSACGDPAWPYQGDHAYPYVGYFWMYDLNDLAAVRAGQAQPWDVVPYEHGEMPYLSASSPDFPGGAGGASYDPLTQRLYVSDMGADGSDPLIRVYAIGGGSAPPTPPDTTPPSVQVTAPANNTTVSGTITLGAAATDDVGVASVWFTVDGSPVGSEDTTAPYQRSLPTSSMANGPYTLRAHARDAAGNSSASSPVTINVYNPPTADGTGPTVELIDPISGSSVTGQVTLTATASDDVGVVGVTFLVDEDAVAPEDTTNTFQVTWDSTGVSDGSHVIRAVARDAAGNSTVSDPVAVTVANEEPPDPTAGVVNVASEAALQAAVAALSSNTTIVIAPGIYQLTSTLWINGSLSNVTVRGATANHDDVVLVGRGMGAPDNNVPHGIWAGGNVTGLTIANLTIRDIAQHPIIFNAGTESPRVSNVRLVNAGQQFIKANPDGPGSGVDYGRIEDSVFEYTDTSVDDYTNAIDVHAGRDWTIRGNLFRRIRAPQGQLAGPTILMWNGSSGSIVEGNTFIDCHREISFGLIDRSPSDHRAGVIRNNFIVRGPGMGGDVGIAVFDSPDTQVVHNTILLNGQYPNAVEYRFPGTTGVVIANNLSDRGVLAREGANASLSGNVWTASADWFVDPSSGDLHLRSDATAAIDRATGSVGTPTDFDGDARPFGVASDVGADEYTGGASAGSPPSDGGDDSGPSNLDTTAPTVSITSPSGGSVSGMVTISAEATDDVGVVGVRFAVNGSTVGPEDTTNSYAVMWDTTGLADGTYILQATARDEAGNQAVSAPVTVSVNNTSVDSTAPTVLLTAPGPGSTVSGAITVSAVAADDVAVAGVRFTVNGTSLGAEDTTNTYEVTWDTSGIPDGAYTLQAIARDRAGNTTASAPLSVAVKNQGANGTGPGTSSDESGDENGSEPRRTRRGWEWRRGTRQ